MSRIETVMNVIQVEMQCEEGGCAGTMRANGTTLTTNPAQYMHVCDNCDSSATYPECYPHYEYRKAAEAPVQSVNGKVGHVLLRYEDLPTPVHARSIGGTGPRSTFEAHSLGGGVKASYDYERQPEKENVDTDFFHDTHVPKDK